MEHGEKVKMADSQGTPTLFSPYKMGKFNLSHRFVYPSTLTTLSFFSHRFPGSRGGSLDPCL
ncbi:hypothetical protein ES319_D05G035200v1 [Gossypium barbadense]|uniref:Uncharacterized protein n=1 Tax=Gossypium barbadense TaxID=3634 RepID=A0A5J5R968_GOSBA|nr:hypothetical protein ES319_D05G035200v1 [Gossypium barbadense]